MTPPAEVLYSVDSDSMDDLGQHILENMPLAPGGEYILQTAGSFDYPGISGGELDQKQLERLALRSFRIMKKTNFMHRVQERAAHFQSIPIEQISAELQTADASPRDDGVLLRLKDMIHSLWYR